ncbi:MAG: FAD:protein FMN transferase [Bacteroidales bacterium]|nr:FAD:protein FMN transferase [Bacteroidales bacterium]
MRNQLLTGLVFICLYSCQPTPPDQLFKFQGRAQGTYYEITYYDTKGRNFQPEIDSLLNAFNFSLSTYEPKSIISRINRDEADVEVDEWFRTVFLKSVDVAEKTGGSFDFSVGPLVNAWGFGFTDRIKINPHVIDSLLKFVGYKNFELQGNKITKNICGSKLDFNAIAQGYAVDVVGDFLQSKGVKVFLVDIGGEVLAHGHKPDGSLWKIGVESPADEASSSRELKAVIALENRAIATSGNYRKFYEEDGMRYSHTIDPFTGYPVRHSLLSASVLASDCMTADAYATAFMVKGVEPTIEFLKSNPELEAYLIYSADNGKIKTWASDGFQALIEKTY